MGTHVPERMQAILAEQLDTLTVEPKTLIQDASVIGRMFWAGALAAVGGTDLETSARGCAIARGGLRRPCAPRR